MKSFSDKEKDFFVFKIHNGKNDLHQVQKKDGNVTLAILWRQ
jgi:hypothetical protein